MGGNGKRSNGKIGGQILPTRPTTSSTSASTHHRVREECAGQHHGGAGDDFLDPDLQAHGSRSTPQTSQEASSRLGATGARATSHLEASTSPRCSFTWVQRLLEARLAKWLMKDGQDSRLSFNALNDPEPMWRYVYVSKDHFCHLIGRGGRVVRQLESFFGTFIMFSDLAPDSRDGEVGIVGPRRTCLFTEFAIEMIVGRQYSILDSLAYHGF